MDPNTQDPPPAPGISLTPADQVLLDRIHASATALRSLLESVNDEWVAEDLIYRFWHQSFKVYSLQAHTERIARALQGLCSSNQTLHPWFLEIIAAGTGKTFELSHNADWVHHAKPIVDAFFHARFMLEMVVKCGEDLSSAPSLLPSGWAAVLELYQIR